MCLLLTGSPINTLLNMWAESPKKKLRDDFKIIACASFHALDVLVSEDRHTLLSPLVIEACKKVNNRNKLVSPTFFSLIDFLARIEAHKNVK